MTNILIGKSKAIKKITKQINTLAVKNDHLLIVGEQGSGKKTVAKAIHAARFGGSEDIPLLMLKPADTDEKELSEILDQYQENIREIIDALRKDFSSLSSAGTIIIEEIDNASYKKQEAILRLFSQINKLWNPPNGAPAIARVIVTIKTDPLKLAYRKQMNPELANLLAQYTRLFVPSLSERKEDIPYLVQHFVTEACGKIGITEPVIDINAVSILVNQPWKNNIQELKTVIDRAVLFSTNGTFTLPHDMVDETAKVTRMLGSIFSAHGQEIDESLDTIERGILDSTLQRFNFNISKAAEFLGMNREILRERVNQLRLVRASK